MDALANIVELLEEGSRYFHGIAMDDEDELRAAEKEFKELEDEDWLAGEYDSSDDTSWMLV